MTTEHIEAAARRTGFVKRVSKIPGTVFLALGTCGVWSDATTSRAQLAAQVTPLQDQLEGSPEALSHRMNKSALACLQDLIRQALANVPALEHVCEAGLFPPCPTVSLAESPGLALPNSFHDLFPGSGGSAAHAGAKIHAVWDYTRRVLDHFALTPWNIPDQKSLAIVVTFANKGVVFLCDVGSLKIKACARSADAGADFFSRLHHQTTLLHTEAGRLQRRERASLLPTVADPCLETPIFLGATEQVAWRLVASRLPASMVNASRRHAKKQAKKKG